MVPGSQPVRCATKTWSPTAKVPPLAAGVDAPGVRAGLHHDLGGGEAVRHLDEHLLARGVRHLVGADPVAAERLVPLVAPAVVVDEPAIAERLDDARGEPLAVALHL